MPAAPPSVKWRSSPGNAKYHGEKPAGTKVSAGFSGGLNRGSHFYWLYAPFSSSLRVLPFYPWLVLLGLDIVWLFQKKTNKNQNKADKWEKDAK